MFDSHIHIRPIKLSNKTGGRLDRTRICRKIEFGSPRGAIHLARTARCSTIQIKEHSQNYQKEQNPEYFDERIIFMSVFNDIEWTKATPKSVHIMPKKWQHTRPSSSQGTGASWDLGQNVRVGTEISTNLKDSGDIVALQLSDMFKCHTSHPIFQRQNHCRLDS